MAGGISFRRLAGIFVYSVFSCVSLDAVVVINVARYRSTKSNHVSPFVLAILPNGSSADKISVEHEPTTSSYTTRHFSSIFGTVKGVHCSQGSRESRFKSSLRTEVWFDSFNHLS